MLAVLILGVLDGLLLAIGISLFLTLKGLTEARIAVLGRLRTATISSIWPCTLTPRSNQTFWSCAPEAPMFFWNAERLMVLLQRTPGPTWAVVKVVVLSLEESPDLDGSCIEARCANSASSYNDQASAIVARLKSKALLQRAHLPGVTLTVLSIDEAVTLARRQTA